jgi:hypothetical protein
VTPFPATDQLPWWLHADRTALRHSLSGLLVAGGCAAVRGDVNSGREQAARICADYFRDNGFRVEQVLADPGRTFIARAALLRIQLDLSPVTPVDRISPEALRARTIGAPQLVEELVAMSRQPRLSKVAVVIDGVDDTVPLPPGAAVFFRDLAQRAKWPVVFISCAESQSRWRTLRGIKCIDLRPFDAEEIRRFLRESAVGAAIPAGELDGLITKMLRPKRRDLILPSDAYLLMEGLA